MSRFFIGTFLSHGIENLRGGTVLCFTKTLLSRKLTDRKGTSHTLTENLLSHTIEKLRKGTLLCFTKFLLSKNFLDERRLGREGLSSASAIISCLTLPRNFVRVSFCVSQNLWLRITLWIREGGGEGGFIKNF